MNDEVKFCPYCNRRVEYTNIGWVCEWCGENLKDDEVTDEPLGDVEYPLGSEDKPDCCIACGGPYPSCKTSCSIFDD